MDMKKCLKIISLILLFSLILGLHYSTFAIDTDITSDAFIRSMNPNSPGSRGNTMFAPFISLIKTVVNNLMKIIQVIGGFLMVVSFAIMGFGLIASGNGPLSKDLGIMNTPNARETLMKYGRNLLIGSVLLFSSSTIVLFVYRAIGK